MLRIEIKSDAEKDVADHFAYISRDNIIAARRLVQSFHRTMQRLAEMPEMGGRWNLNVLGLKGCSFRAEV